MYPGTPLIYGTFAAAGDMATGKIVLGGPEIALLNAATAQMCRKYGIPLGYGTGGTSDSPAADLQTGAEKMLTLLSEAIAGVEVIHDAVGGLLGSAMCFSPAQMVLDNELCQMVDRLLRGIEVSAETMALDLLDAVGPGGNFLAEDHTVSHFRREHFLPKLMNRTSIGDWPGSDADPLMVERARQRARRILATHKPNAVDAVTRGRMESVLQAAGVNISLFHARENTQISA
jgi:trimethylamine--corrinoid protein Co-methyltransferase